MRTSQLDSMLGSLQSDMTKQGVSTVKKGTCAACNKPIIGQVCTALGKTWHPEHFSCVACELPLGSRNFFEREGKPFCEKDYHELYAPRCAYCNGPILDVSRRVFVHCGQLNFFNRLKCIIKCLNSRAFIERNNSN